MSHRSSRSRTLAGCVCILILGGACVGPFSRGSHLSYVQAHNRLIELVEGGLRAGMNGREPTEEPVDWDDICTDSNLAPTGEIYPTYTYHFPLEDLGPNPEAFVDRVAGYWESEGLRLDPDNDDEEITGMFATSSDGFAMQTFVNRRTGKALVAGSGPCVEGELDGFEDKFP